MALLWMDGFQAGNLTERYATVASPDIVTTPTPPTHHSTSLLRANSGSDSVERAISTAAGATVTTGFLFRTDQASSNERLISFWSDGQSRAISPNSSVWYNGSTDQFSVRRDSTVLTTGTLTVAANTWAYLEIQLKIDDASGVFKVKIDGQLDIDFSGDTRHSSNSTALEGVQLGNNLIIAYFTDWYICDGTGSIRNDFLGSCEVAALTPNADGYVTDFTPLSSTNVSNVDEVGDHDGDTSYNAASVEGNKDAFDMTTISNLDGRQILGLQAEVVASKDDSGAKYARPFIRPATTDTPGTSVVLAQGSYKLLSDIWEQNPDDSLDFEQADIDGLEVGVEVRNS
jgi:hypothetical protein